MDIFISAQNFGIYNAEAIEILESSNLNYYINKTGKKLSNEETSEQAKNAKVIIAGTEPLYHLVEKSNSLRAICRLGTGTDNIPLNVCSSKNIEIFTADSYVAESVSEFVLSIILASSRNLIDQNQKCKQGSWDKIIGSSISDLTIGVLGFGAIGKKLVELLSKLSFKEILIFDSTHDNLKSESPIAFGKNIKFVSNDYLLKHSDVISIHIPLTKENYEIVDFNFLNKVKSDLVLINTSRGQIINEDHLLNILDKKLKLVALDVFNKEPYSGPLLTHPKIIATPHIASYTLKSRQEIEIVCLKKAIDVASTLKG